MALFRVQIRKAFVSTLDSYKWSNIWYVDHDDVSSAAAVGEVIWVRERVFHGVDAFCYEIYASDLVPNTQNFVIRIPASANMEGTFTQTGDLYRSSSVCRVDLTVLSSRPSRKFYRVPFTEDTVTAGLTLSTAFNAALDSGMTAVFTDAGSRIRDESGNVLQDFVNRGLTDKRLGKEARVNVPSAPA